MRQDEGIEKDEGRLVFMEQVDHSTPMPNVNENACSDEESINFGDGPEIAPVEEVEEEEDYYEPSWLAPAPAPAPTDCRQS